MFGRLVQMVQLTIQLSLMSTISNLEQDTSSLDGGTQADPTDDKCGPVHLDTEGINANLWLHIPNGPSTQQELSLSNGREIGSQII